MELLISYLRKPEYIKTEKINWNLFFKYFLLFYLVSIPISLFSGLLIKLLNISNVTISLSTIKLLLIGIIIGPIIEEILFRLLLKPISKNIVIFLCFSIGISIRTGIKGEIIYAFTFSLVAVLCILILVNMKYLKIVQRKFLFNFNYVFYLSCILFGLLHVGNYSPFNIKLLLVIPILVLPQFIGGTIMGYLRMKFGILYSIIFHVLMNSIPILLILINGNSI